MSKLTTFSSTFHTFEDDLTPDGYCIGGEQIEFKHNGYGDLHAVIYKGVDILPIISQFGGMRKLNDCVKYAKTIEEIWNS